MKQKILLLSASMACGVASAQSSVTVFGLLDMGVSRYQVSGGQSRTELSHSAHLASRLGFRGTEDLGGGWSAGFHLEAPLSPDDGTASGLNFARRSTLSLVGPYGELRLGRDYTPSFWNDVSFDPFGPGSVGTNLILMSRLTTTATPFAPGVAGNNPTVNRSSNSIGYFLPKNLGGFYGQAMYAFHEQSTAGQTRGRYVGLRGGYASGPLDMAIAHGQVDGATPATAAAPDVKTSNLGASYNLGAIKLMGELSRESLGIANGRSVATGALIGFTAPVGVGEIRVAYSRVAVDHAGTEPRASRLAVGYVHSLSKRTSLYAIAGSTRNSGGATMAVGSLKGVADRSASGYNLGVRHAF
jgi:predicted porin